MALPQSVPVRPIIAARAVTGKTAAARPKVGREGEHGRVGHFRTWLGCFLSEMTTAQLGEEHASPTEIWLSPNARDEPPSDPRGVIRIARKLYLKDSVLRDGAMEQKR